MNKLVNIYTTINSVYIQLTQLVTVLVHSKSSRQKSPKNKKAAAAYCVFGNVKQTDNAVYLT